MRAAALFWLLALLAGPVAAQEASVKETRCWAGDVAFSAGAGLNAGEGGVVCQPGSGWTRMAADAPVLGCLLEGELSSVGAVLGIRNSDSLVIQCAPNGRWVRLAIEADGQR
tara:strand:+ start:12796 stop:13131 length:336 start_codon:yes stop_codon:yes gene_type:complete